MTAAGIPDPELSEPPEGFGLVPIGDLCDLLDDDCAVEVLDASGEPWEQPLDHAAIEVAKRFRFLIPARITSPASPEPETEWVPLSQCLGREVLVDGERRVVEMVNVRHGGASWWDDSERFLGWRRIPVRADGMVEVLAR